MNFICLLSVQKRVKLSREITFFTFKDVAAYFVDFFSLEGQRLLPAV